MEQKLQRYGPLGAILGIILVLVSFVVHGKWASTEESAQEIADLYVQNQDRVFMGSWVCPSVGVAKPGVFEIFRWKFPAAIFVSKIIS